MTSNWSASSMQIFDRSESNIFPVSQIESLKEIQQTMSFLGWGALHWLGSGGPVLLPFGLTELWELFHTFLQVRSSITSRLRLSMSSREWDVMKGELKSEIYAYIYGYHLFQITSLTLEKYYHYRKIEIKMFFFCILTGPLLFSGRGALQLHSKVISMLLYF